MSPARAAIGDGHLTIAPQYPSAMLDHASLSLPSSLAPPNRLGAHLTAAFCGAFTDNLFRGVVAGMLMILAEQQLGKTGEGLLAGTRYGVFAGLAFLIPMVLFAPLAGALGDRLAKHHLLRWVRLLDLPVVLIGVAGLWLGSLPLLLTCLALLGTAATIFATVKYSALAELVPAERLTTANAVLQAVSTVAILFGFACAGLADQVVMDKLGLDLPPALVVLVIASLATVVGIVAAWRVPVLAPQAPTTPIRWWDLPGSLSALKGEVLTPAIGLAGFWGLGLAAHLMIAPVAHFAFGLHLLGQSALSVALAIGIVCGALTAPRLMHRAWPAGLPLAGVLIAAVALIWAGAVASAALHRPAGSEAPTAVWFGILLFIVGFGAGTWEIPLQVLIQERAPAATRNRIQAAASVLGCIAMVASSFLCLGLIWAGFDAASIIWLLGLATLACVLVSSWIWRRHLAGWAVRAACCVLWRIEVTGAEHVPATGGCLIACTHPSYADGQVLSAALPRPARYLVYQKFMDMPVVGWLLHWAGAIRVASDRPGRALIAALEAASSAAKAGEVVAIYPEGQVARAGGIAQFKTGIERIAKSAQVPIIPVLIQGTWGGLWSLAPRKRWWDWLPLPLRRVTVSIGPALPCTASAAEIRAAVIALDYQQAQRTAEHDRGTLGAGVLARAKRSPFKTAIHDLRGTMPLWKLVAVAKVALPRFGLAADERRVGVLLPPGQSGALVNLALALDGRTAVNLNHTAGEAQVRRMCDLAKVKTVISAGIYLEKIAPAGMAAAANGAKPRFPVPGRLVLLEETLPGMSTLSVLWQAVLNLFLPCAWRDRSRADDAAAIVFSSGSTGDPKGVPLTHRQILANNRGAALALDLDPGRREALLTPLPLFHSFGLSTGMWLPLSLGITIIAHPDPTDGVVLGRLAEAGKATFFIGTATFVRGWMRRIEPERFKTLRFGVVGAEKCPKELRTQFTERYRVPLLEGYGCTELGPAVAFNQPDVTAKGATETRTRDGSVGRALPGIEVFTIDPATRQRIPPDSEGLLVVRSPARMTGYLDRPELTAKAIIDNGYDTGDIGRVDADGFIFITGRLARFAKIGGEMVPLDHVEELISAAALALAGSQPADTPAHEVAVAAVPDAGRGERLVILHTGLAIDWEKAIAACTDLPPLWRPRAKDAFKIPAMPHLGTGKRDLGGVKKLAAQVTA